MKKLFYLLFLLPIFLTAQTYLHPTTGINSEFVGSCVEMTCGGNYFDNGGAGGNYSNNINNIYRVFCPNIAGNCLRVTFTSFSTESGFDYLQVRDGATQNSTLISTLTGNLSGSVPFSITANNPSGCLSFRFRSDGSIRSTGWSATFSCVPCATLGNGPNGADNNDCITATALCNTVSVIGNSSGPGLVSDGCTQGTCPAGGENHTNWFSVTVTQAGTLSILIDPDDNNDDYDFAIYGPNVSCNSLGLPIRCTDSGLTGNTGTVSGSGDNIETVLGNKFIEPINVSVGQTYYIVVDEWSPASNSGYTLNLNGTAQFECSPLSVNIKDFNGFYSNYDNAVKLEYEVENENNIKEYVVEYSKDGNEFLPIKSFEAINNFGNNKYEILDYNSLEGIYNYYRIKNIDYTGIVNYSEIISIIYEKNNNLIFPTIVEDGILNLKLTDNCVISIYSFQGKLVYNNNLSINDTKINIDELTTGNYIVRITNTDNTFFEYKIIKK